MDARILLILGAWLSAPFIGKAWGRRKDTRQEEGLSRSVLSHSKRERLLWGRFCETDQTKLIGFSQKVSTEHAVGFCLTRA